MTATAADVGFSATFGIEGGTPGTYVTVAEIVSITPPGLTREAIDATHLASPDGFKEYIAGKVTDQTDASIVLNYTAANATALIAAFTAGSGKFEITRPDGSAFRFAGIVTSWAPGDLTPDGKIEATLTIKPSGAPTEVAA